MLYNCVEDSAIPNAFKALTNHRKTVKSTIKSLKTKVMILKGKYGEGKDKHHQILGEWIARVRVETS